MTTLKSLSTNTSFAQTLRDLKGPKTPLSHPFPPQQEIVLEPNGNSDSTKAPLAFASGAIAVEQPSSSWDQLPYRQDSYGCGHLNFRLSAGLKGRSLNWVALRNS